MWASPCKIRSVSEKSVYWALLRAVILLLIPSHRVTSDRSVFPVVGLKFVSLIVQSGWFSPPEVHVRLFGMGVDEAQGGTYLPPRGLEKSSSESVTYFHPPRGGARHLPISRSGYTRLQITVILFLFHFILCYFISTVFCLVCTIKIDWSIDLFMLFCFFTVLHL